VLQTRRDAMLAVLVLVTIAAGWLLCWGIDCMPRKFLYQPVKWMLRMAWCIVLLAMPISAAAAKQHYELTAAASR